MAGVVYGAPYRPPAPPVDPWKGMPQKWVGWDGSVWDLTGDASGVRLMPGVRGLGPVKHTHWRSSSPAVAGSRWRGAVADARDVFWPVFLFNDQGSREWVEYDRAFWRTLDPQKTGTWVVELPDGSTRSLVLRFEEDSQPEWELDPVLSGWATYGIRFTADDPFWAGGEVTRAWQPASTVDFFNGSAKAPSFNISSGSTLANASLTNPGDVDAYVRWTVHGPFSSVVVGVGGATVAAPIEAAAGQTLVIDTDPSIQAALLDGVDVTAQLTSAEFGVLPPGQAVPLSLSLVGAGWIEAAFTPRYFRAW